MIEKPWKGKQETWLGKKDLQGLTADVCVLVILSSAFGSQHCHVATVQIKTDTLTATEIVTGEETEEEIEMDHAVVAAGKIEPLGVGSRTYQLPLEQNAKK